MTLLVADEAPPVFQVRLGLRAFFKRIALLKTIGAGHVFLPSGRLLSASLLFRTCPDWALLGTLIVASVIVASFNLGVGSVDATDVSGRMTAHVAQDNKFAKE